MILFLLAVVLVLLVFAPNVLLMGAMFIVPIALAICIIGCMAGWIVRRSDQQKLADEEERREKARMMPTLYGP